MKVNVIRRGKSRVTLESQMDFQQSMLEDSTIVWLDLITSERADLNKILSGIVSDPAVFDRLNKPGKTFRMHAFGEIMLLDIHLARPGEIGSSTFLTLLFFEDRLITVGEIGIHKLQYFSSKVDGLAIEFSQRERLIYYFLNQVIDDDLNFSRIIRNKIDQFKHSLADGFKPEDLKVISRLRDEVVVFAEVLEDQFLSIGLIPDTVDKEVDSKALQNLRQFASHFEHIQSRLERYEDKLEYLFQQYQNSVQEETNRRINTLTIVQAIFVPLTFIAGIYGMNFTKMPELEWTNGYFYALGLMGLIALAELGIFWRSGWFK